MARANSVVSIGGQTYNYLVEAGRIRRTSRHRTSPPKKRNRSDSRRTGRSDA